MPLVPIQAKSFLGCTDPALEPVIISGSFMRCRPPKNCDKPRLDAWVIAGFTVLGLEDGIVVVNIVERVVFDDHYVSRTHRLRYVGITPKMWEFF